MRAEVLALFPPGVTGAELQDLSEAPEPLPEEQPLVQRAVDKRRREFAAGRACARSALGQLGIEPQPILADDRAPRWPQGAVGSITHTDGYAAAVAGSRDGFAGLGLDAECSDRVKPRLWKQIAGEEEVRWLEKDAALADLHGTILFSAKEAFYKAQYSVSQAWVGFHDVVLRCDEAGAFEVELSVDVPGLGVSGTRYTGRYALLGELVITALALPRPR